MSVISLTHLILQCRYAALPLSLEKLRSPEPSPEQKPKLWKEEKEIVETEGGGKIETIDLQPENMTDPVPVLLAPSWAGSIEANRNALETLAKSGRRAVSLNHARHGGEPPPPEEIPELLKDVPIEELRKAESLLVLLESKEITQADVVAHSEGAANALVAAMLAPERFRNIVLVGPAGLIGEDHPVRLAGGFVKDSLSERKPSLEEMPLSKKEQEQYRERGVEPERFPSKLKGPPFSKRALTDMLKYVVSNPSRSAKEVIGIAYTRLEKIVEELHSRGVGIVIISNVDDPVFPTREISKMVNAKIIDGFLSVRGGHGELVGKPEHFMTAAEEMLRSLHAKQVKEQQDDKTQLESAP